MTDHNSGDQDPAEPTPAYQPHPPGYVAPPAYPAQPGPMQPGLAQPGPMQPGLQPHPQQPYPQNSYPQNPYAQGYGPRPGGQSAMAIVSMILGIVGVLIGWLLTFGLMGVAAIVLGFIARSRIRRYQQRGAGMALAGIILGFVGIVFLTAFLAVVGITASEQ